MRINHPIHCAVVCRGVTWRDATHQLWVPSQFNVFTFARSGLDPAKLFVVPEPMNVTLFDPETTTPLRLNTGKSYHFLAVYAWNDRKVRT
jgi:hypothetical protein